MLTPTQIWLRTLNRKLRRALKSARFWHEPNEHISRQDMGITTRPQFTPKKPKC